MPKEHRIKLKEKYADAVLHKKKTFEIRFNDRDYQEGDIVIFQVVNDNTCDPVQHQLNQKRFVITYLLTGLGLQEQWCAFSVKMLKFESRSLPTIEQMRIRFDPNTQCVDCPYGILMYSVDGVAKAIRCEAFPGQVRSAQDTCLANVVDLNSFTAGNKKEKQSREMS